MKLRLVMVSAAITGLTLALALGAGEAVTRYRERHRTVVPGTMPTLFYRHARLRHGLVRDFSYYGWASVDSFGFRRTNGGGRPGARRPTVLILGGSTTFDSQVSGDDRAWPARLETLLREGPSSFLGEVINGGVPGYRVVDILVRLETELADFQPDLLLLYESHNDLYAALGPRAALSFTQRPGRAVTLTPWTRPGGRAPAPRHVPRPRWRCRGTRFSTRLRERSSAMSKAWWRSRRCEAFRLP